MKRVIYSLITSIIILVSTALSAQDWTEKLPQGKVKSGNLTFFDYQKAFNDYWEPFNVKDGKYLNEKGELVKASGWKQFKRWEWYWEVRVNPLTGEFPKTTAYEEFQKYNETHPGGSRSTAGNWTSIGPTSSPGGYAGLGRINCVAFHPTDNNIIYTGAASGGLWKTTDGGASWTVLSDGWASQGCSDICVVSGTPNTVYAATGDRENTMWHFGGGQDHDNNSVGVLISTDAGATWSSTGLSFALSEKKAINRLLIDPTNSLILYAATSSGVYKTTDAGANWSLIYATQFSDMEFKPGDPTTIYGSSKAGDIYRSTNSGGSWTATLSTTFGRVEMAVTPINSNVVYAVMQDLPNPNNESPVYKSVDGGSSFTRVFNSSTLNLFGYDCDGSDMAGSQASYDLCIAVDPSDANVVFIGGVNTYKSTDGGSTWNISTHWSSTCGGIATKVHADQHCLAYQPVSNHLFLGNDGGLYKTTNSGTSWTYIGSGLVTTQIYRIGVAQSVDNECQLGAQDNGSKAYFSGIWSDVGGGDGGECFFDYTDQNVMYYSSQNGSFKRSTNHGGSEIAITAGLTGDSRFIAPFAIDPNVHTTIYCAYSDVWKSTNQGTDWTKISNWGTAEISNIAIAPSNSQYIYATTQTILYRTTDGGTSWSNITGTLPVGSSLITYFSVKNDDPNTVWVSMGTYTANRVYQTTDGGATWTSISSGLPNIPVMCVIQNKQNTSDVELYAGTDVGVYLKVGAADWQLFSTNLPTLVVNELEIYYDANPGNSKLYAGTYGRGMWVSDLYESGVLNPTNVTATASSDTQIDLSWALASGNDVMLAYNTSPTFGTPVNGTTYTTTIPGGGTVLYNGSNTTFNHTLLSPNTTYYYKIWSKDGSTTYSTGVTANTSTFCTLISSFPWTEGFEHAGAMPECWTQEYIDGANPWEMQTQGTNGHPASAHTGTYLARNRTTTSSAGYVTKFESPALDISSVSTPVLKFWHTQETDGVWTGPDELRVYYKTSINGSWNLLATYTSSIASWTQESILLPNASSAYFIAFESTVNAGYGVCIDDIIVRENGSCNSGEWTGAVSTDWHDLANWCDGFVPNSATDVTIPAGPSNMPLISNADATCRNITIANTASLTISTARVLAVTGDWTNNGTFTAGNGTVNFNGTNDLQTIAGSASTSFNILKVTKGAQSRVLEATSIISLTGASNPLVLTSGTFKLSSASTIIPFTSAPTFNNVMGLWVNHSGATVSTGNFSWTLGGLLRISSGTLNIGSISGNGLTYYNGTFIIEGGNLNIAGRFRPSTAEPVYIIYNQSGGVITVNTVGSTATTSYPFEIFNHASTTFTMSGGTIVIQKEGGTGTHDLGYYNLASTNNVTGGTLQIGNASTPASQTMQINSTVPIYNLTINSTNSPTAKLLTNGLTVKNDVTISGGTLNVNNLNLNVGGNWTNNGSFTPGTATVTFNGTGAQSISKTGGETFYNLTVDKSSNTLSLNNDVTVSNALALTNGIVSISSNIIYPQTASRTNGWVNGNLKLPVATGTPTKTFYIGDADNYAPATVAFTNVTTGGQLTAVTLGSTHPNLATSGISTSKYVNRYHTFTNSGIVFTNSSGTATATVNWVAGDIQGGADWNSFMVAKYDSPDWTAPTYANRAATSIDATGLTSFSDIQVGEIGCTNVGLASASATASPICPGTTTTLTYSGLTGTNASVTWYDGTGGTGTSYGTGTPSSAVGPGTYYAYATGDCGSPVEISVVVGTKVNVGLASASATASPICPGTTTTLTYSGLTGTNAIRDLV